MPCIAWGYGRSPTSFEGDTYSLLAVSWGPLIQLLCLKDISADQPGEGDFVEDGYYILSPSTETTKETTKNESDDLH